MSDFDRCYHCKSGDHANCIGVPCHCDCPHGQSFHRFGGASKIDSAWEDLRADGGLPESHAPSTLDDLVQDVERLRVLAQLSARGTDGHSWGRKSEIDAAAERVTKALRIERRLDADGKPYYVRIP